MKASPSDLTGLLDEGKYKTETVDEKTEDISKHSFEKGQSKEAPSKSNSLTTKPTKVPLPALSSPK